MKKTLAVLSWATFSLVGQQALAAQSNGYSTSADGRLTTALNPPAHIVPRAAEADPDTSMVLFSNLNSDPSNVYDCCSGWTISAAGSAVGQDYADAMPFTPTVSGKVKKITVAVGYVTGSNAVTVRLNADAGGVPGAVIQTFMLTSLPVFGTCCTVETVAAKGVTLTAGVPYWVVVRTTKPSSDTWNAWNINTTDTSDKTFAFRSNGVWSQVSGPLGAFEVLGR